MTEADQKKMKWEPAFPDPWRLIPNLGLPSAMFPAIHLGWALAVVSAWALHQDEIRVYVGLYLFSALIGHYMLRSLAGLRGAFLLGDGYVSKYDYWELVLVFELGVLVVFIGTAVEIFVGHGTVANLLDSLAKRI